MGACFFDGQPKAVIPPTHQRFNDTPDSCDVPSTPSTPPKSCISVYHPAADTRHMATRFRD